MLIDCPTCSRCYTVDQAELGSSGRMVICPRCQTRWFAGDASRQPPQMDLQRLIGSDRTVALEHSSSRVTPARRRGAGRLAPVAVMLAIIGTTCAGLVVGREGVVRLAPQAAVLYAAAGLKVHVHGLDFGAVAMARRDAASSDVVISGEIRNQAKHRLAVPRLVYDVKDQSGASLVRWTEGTHAHALAPGRMLEFASSPHHLPSESRSVLVTFEADDEPPAPTLASLSEHVHGGTSQDQAVH